MKSTSAAERELFSKILEELFKELGKTDGTITSNTGRALKLSRAIDKIFEHFNANTNMKIVRGIADDLAEVGTLNQKYFSTFKKRAQQLQSIYSSVDKTMQARIGITESGKFVKGGYLDTLLHDNSLKNDILRATRQAFGNKEVDMKQYLGKIREVIIGDEKHMGRLSHHYRTFAHDTYSQFDNEYADRVAQKLQLRCAVYEGGVIGTTRDFCRKKDGKVFTRAEIEAFKDDPDLLLTKDEQKAGRPLDYNPFSDKGRWNCRHYWLWITDEEAIRLRPQLKTILKEAA